MKILVAALLLHLTGGMAGAGEPKADRPLEDSLRRVVEQDYAEEDLQRMLFVSVPRQRMYLVEDGVFARSWVVSTAKAGTGNRKNSLKTPLGLHEVCSKHGRGVPLGGIFKGRIYTGKQAEIISDETDLDSDDVTSRVLRLCGRESGRNKGGQVDTFERRVYIHGTPEEGLLGNPASNGCVRMKNDEIIELFEMVDVGIPVLILDL
ncbi:MAG TPA: L,D-transpeptidase [Acidobacteriota bacterium]|nr:L,D-transpeptidase [Acidobacteriota bacterium]